MNKFPDSVGGTIAFGYYNGSTIQWYILDNDTTNHWIMLLSMDILEKMPYNPRRASITWKKSTIRSWLNGYASSYNNVGNDYTGNNFINIAFSTSEKVKIVSSNVPAHANPKYSTSPGNATTDKIFLLSITEVNNLLGTGSNMCTKIHSATMWWLRSPGGSADRAANVNTDGSVYLDGVSVDRGGLFGVRPALWVNY